MRSGAAMRVVLFGATGMVGQGVLRECLRDDRVRHVLCVGRSPTGQHHAKLDEIALGDLFAIDTIADRLAGCDACFFCAGVTSAGRPEADYTRLTYDLTLTVAAVLARLGPDMTFVYVSGAGTDGTGRSRFMWARVKGRTENALLALPFKAAYMLRPGAIQPLHGVRSKTGWYRVLYAATAPLYPLLARLVPNALTTTEQMGRAMIGLAAEGYGKRVLETPDINAIP